MNFPTQGDLFKAVDTLTEPEPRNPDYTDYMFMSFYQLAALAQDERRYSALTPDSREDLMMALLSHIEKSRYED